MEKEVSRKLNLPKLEQYDGTTEPEDHLAHYQNCMTLQNGLTDPILCRAFITNLKEAALSWFHRLPVRSIDSFSELAERFTARFVASKHMRRAPAYLLQIKEQKGESLRQYVSRFNSELTTIDGCGDEFIVTAMARGLLPGRLADSMLKNPHATTTQMLEKAQNYIKLEEFKQTRREEEAKDKEETSKRARPSGVRAGVPQFRGEENKPGASLGLMEPIDKVFHAIKNNVKLRYPAPMRYPLERRDKSRFCDFHNEVGHRTDECKHLAWELENLAKDGQLDDFLKTKTRREKVARTEEVCHESESSRRPPRDQGSNTIYVIHAQTEIGGLTKAERKRKLHELYALSAHPMAENGGEDIIILSFSDKDRYGVKYPRDDPLVVTMRVAGFNVRRVLVDNGSSVNILFYKAFQEMKFEVSEFLPSNSVMSGFSGETNTPLGRIKLSVQIGEGKTQRVILTTFFVVKFDSPYNIILGRTWMHDMQAFASSYHQCLRYPVGKEIGTLVGNPVTARECLTSALK